MHRHNSAFIGDFEDIKVIGYKSQFTMIYTDNQEKLFCKSRKRNRN